MTLSADVSVQAGRVDAESRLALLMRNHSALDAQLQKAGYLEPGVGPYGAWCLRHTLKDMLLFVYLGFELGARLLP